MTLLRAAMVTAQPNYNNSNTHGMGWVGGRGGGVGVVVVGRGPVAAIIREKQEVHAFRVISSRPTHGRGVYLFFMDLASDHVSQMHALRVISSRSRVTDATLRVISSRHQT